MAAYVALTMNASGVFGFEEECTGCFRKFRRGEQMTAVEYDDGSQAGWHCADCLALWKAKGEDALLRWTANSDADTKQDVGP